MNSKVFNLIKYIVCYATDHEIALTTIRLVKFVYLADLYNARFNNGMTITGFPWAFINYGPYCSDVMQSIDDAALKGFINSKAYESNYSDKDYRRFSCDDDSYPSIKKEFQLAVVSELQYAILKYGDDTAQLLDYVYFDTEPMRNVKKGDRLDFSLAEQPQPLPSVETNKLSKGNIQAAKAIVAKLKEKHEAARANLIRDEIEATQWKDQLYYDTLDVIDSEPLPTGLKGIARIRI